MIYKFVPLQLIRSGILALCRHRSNNSKDISIENWALCSRSNFDLYFYSISPYGSFNECDFTYAYETYIENT